jgi:hypothetical protein
MNAVGRGHESDDFVRVPTTMEWSNTFFYVEQATSSWVALATIGMHLHKYGFRAKRCLDIYVHLLVV